MALENLLKELASLSPEEMAKLQQIFGGNKQIATEKIDVKKKNPPAAPKAGKVYFFKQMLVLETERIEKKGDEMKKYANQLPPRVIAVDRAQAWRIYWKSRGKYMFLGSSDGRIWRQARSEGKSVNEAQALEYEEMLKHPDMTPPMNMEKTVFRGTKLAQVTRGEEVDWGEGLKQTGSS